MFKIGQKVVCINDKNQANSSIIGKLNPVKNDYIYTIRKIDSVGGLIFNEFIQGYYHDGEEAGFNQSRFKPLKDTWVDELLCRQCQKMKEEIILPEIEDRDIATVEVLHDLLIDGHGYSKDFDPLERARELTAKMYRIRELKKHIMNQSKF